MNTFLKYTTFILGLVCLALAALTVSFAGQARRVVPLPIYIDKATGAAKAVDYRTVDGGGGQRPDVEVIDFCNAFVSNLYTFNRYTIRSSLEAVFSQAVPEVREKLKYYLHEADRAAYVRSNAQGIGQVAYTDVVSLAPDIKVQVAFRKQILGGDGRESEARAWVAIMRLRPVGRSVQNSHGLLVVDYRESQLPEFADEKSR